MHLGMAGLAEWVMGINLLIGLGITVVGAICIAPALSLRSRLAASGAVCAATVCAVLHQPWSVFYPVASSEPDSDAIFWLSWYRFYGVVWMIVTALALVSVYVAWSKTKRGKSRS